MKEIKDYFISPTNIRASTELVENPEVYDKDADQNKNTENKLPQDLENSETIIKEKKNKRKSSVPAVKDVPKLISNNLSLISKLISSSPGKKNKVQEVSQKSNCNSTSIVSNVNKSENNTSNVTVGNNEATGSNDNDVKNQVSIQVDDSELETSKVLSKTNAFQFLMNSRHTIIGQNSNGKSVKDLDSTIEEQQKLTSRKNLFHNWANQKGALKRKREEKEVECCINKKLEKRAKRLKNMLQISDKSDKDRDKNDRRVKPIVKRKKIAKRISSSDSESGSDLNRQIEESHSKSLVKIPEMDENALDDNISLYHSKLKENSLLNIIGVANLEEEIEVNNDFPKEREKEVIKVKMFTPKSNKKRVPRLSLKKQADIKLKDDFGSLDRVKNLLEVDGCRLTKKNKKKNKQKYNNLNKKYIESEAEPKLNDSGQDFCSPDHKTNKKTDKYDEESTLSKIVVDDSSQESVKKVEIKKKKKKHYTILDDESQFQSKFINNSSQISQMLSPKTTRTWKMRIKISEDGTCTKTSQTCIKDEIKTKNHELVSRVLRPKRTMVSYNEIFKKKLNNKPAKKKHKLKTISADKSIEKVEVELLSDSEYEEDNKKKNVGAKLAPVFLKATPKPKVDQEIIKARKKFLMSGIPDLLKKTVEKQKSIEDKEYDVFPTVSHVQQKCNSKFWDLPKPNLQYIEISSLNIGILNLNCHHLVHYRKPYELNLTTEVQKIDQLKTILNQIKSDNPNYPVYKAFRHIYEKSGKNLNKKDTTTNKSPRLHAKNGSHKSSGIPETQESETSKELEIWTEKYKARSSEEILGNHNGVTALKKWLVTWINYSEEINARSKRKRSDSNSESDFESTDCDSRDSTRLPGNTIVLGGPCGSGKTSAVYAIANELAFNVLELNASSKRTGKKLIQELQEATQSHQVRKKETNSLSNFMQTKELKRYPKNNKDKRLEENVKKLKSTNGEIKKMCILLVEDVDLVFEQDEGFLTSITQLIATSKRPIILTTTDNSSAHVQKFTCQYEYILFMPLSLNTLAIWLQLVCLVEGLLVDKHDLGNLLEYNKGDIRKTILQVQFWVQSGGQLIKDQVLPLTTSRHIVSHDLKAEDEPLSLNLTKEKSTFKYFVHKQCLGSFEIFRENNCTFNIPYYLNLGTLWWNIPSILDISDCSDQEDTQHIKKNSLSNEIKIDAALNFYDSLVLTDVLFKSVGYSNTLEPVVRCWSTDVKDSLELSEREEGRSSYLDFVHNVTHTLVNGCIEDYKNIDDSRCLLNMAMPDSSERRCRAKQHICEDFLKEPISWSSTLERTSVALDYLPMLREIARSEEKRASANTKRGNRFRHYLKNLNMDFKDSTCKLACRVLTLNDD